MQILLGLSLGQLFQETVSHYLACGTRAAFCDAFAESRQAKSFREKCFTTKAFSWIIAKKPGIELNMISSETHMASNAVRFQACARSLKVASKLSKAD